MKLYDVPEILGNWKNIRIFGAVLLPFSKKISKFNVPESLIFLNYIASLLRCVRRNFREYMTQ